MDDGVSSIIFMILLQVVLIGLNAVFACAEIAVISMNDNKLAKMAAEGDKRAIKLARLTSQPARFLATIQVAITLSGFLGSAFAAENFSGVLVDWLLGMGVPLSEKVLDSMAVVLITIILSYFTLVFGELVPKQVAMRKAEPLALGMSGLISGIAKVFAPIVSFLTVSTNAVLRLLGIDPNAEDDEVSEEELGKVKAVIKQLQPHAKVIETNYAKVDLDEILDVNLFDFEKAISSAGWVEGIENHDELHEHHCHEHDHECCCHHHDEEEHECHCGCHSHGESEYGITTFVYYIRDGFNRKKFMNFVENFDKSIIRCKGVLYFEDEDNMSYLFEQAGRQKTLMEAGEWFCVLPKEESDKLRQIEPKLEKDWDEKYGDRMVKLVFIGQHMDKDKIISDLDKCV